MRAGISLVVTISVVLTLLAACAPAAPTAAPTSPPAPTAASSAPAAATSAAPAAPKAAATTVPQEAGGKGPLSVGVKPGDKPKRGGTLRVVQDKDSVTMDPHIVGAGDINTWALLYNTLLGVVRNESTGGWDFKGELAESWEQKDPTTLVFKLRKGIKFHDGSDFNAAVAAWNLTRTATHPKAGLLTRGARDIKEAKALDDYTVQLTLKAPSAPFMYDLAQTGSGGGIFMLSKAAVDKYGDEYGTKPENTAGTGPFKVIEWLKGDHETFGRFDGYWEMGADGKPLPYVDKVIARLIPDPNVALVELKSGNVDVIERIMSKDVASVKAAPNLVYYEAPWAGANYTLALNTKRAPYDNKKVRQAINYAIDREAVAKVVGFGVDPATYYWWKQGQPGYDPSLPKYTHDPAKAKQLMAEADAPSDGFEVSYVSVNRPQDVTMSEVIQEQLLRAINVRVKIDKLDQTAWQNATRGGNWDQTQTRVSLTAPDPSIFSTWIYTGNSYGYSNPDVDRLFDKGRASYDRKEQDAAYKELQKVLFEDAGLAPVFFWMRNDVTSKKVKGWMPQPWHWNLRYVWLEE